MKQYIQNYEERDILFVFGAGASMANEAPSQNDILRMILNLEDKELESADIANQVIEFIKENFCIKYAYPSLESIFGYMDYFISRKESLSGKYTLHKISVLKESLTILIHYIIARSSSTEKNIYKPFWERVAKINRNVSILTLNYDTFIDESFDSIYADYAYIDYCIELMNYNHEDKIDPFDWWINPRKPVDIWNNSDPKPIKIIKVHGSLNWKYCNCCNQVLLTAWDTMIDIKSSSFKKSAYYEHLVKHPESERICPLDNKVLETLIVPPSHIKNLNNPIANKLLDEGAIEIRKSKNIVFIGYSLPEADVHIKALFKKNLYNDINIYVINRSINKTIKSNYQALSDSVSFYECTFEDFINKHLDRLLSSLSISYYPLAII